MDYTRQTDANLAAAEIIRSENKSYVYLTSGYPAPGGRPRKVHVEGDYTYVSCFTAGLTVLNIEKPECIQEGGRFDTYPANDDSSFNVGCWGVYPHTGGRRTVYASNIEVGKRFILRSDISPVTFAAAPVVGSAPLGVDFTDSSPFASSWD